LNGWEDGLQGSRESLSPQGPPHLGGKNALHGWINGEFAGINAKSMDPALAEKTK